MLTGTVVQITVLAGMLGLDANFQQPWPRPRMFGLVLKVNKAKAKAQEEFLIVSAKISSLD